MICRIRYVGKVREQSTAVQQQRAERKEKEQVKQGEITVIQTQNTGEEGCAHRARRCIAIESLKSSHRYAEERDLCHSRVYGRSKHSTHRQLARVLLVVYCCTLPKLQVAAALPPVLASTIQPRSPPHPAVSCPPQGRQSTDTPSGSDSVNSLSIRSQLRDSRPRFP